MAIFIPLNYDRGLKGTSSKKSFAAGIHIYVVSSDFSAEQDLGIGNLSAAERSSERKKNPLIKFDGQNKDKGEIRVEIDRAEGKEKTKM